VNTNILSVRDLLAVLAEPNRRRLLALLTTGDLTVSDLAKNFGVTRSAISQHLAVLAGVGLVEGRQEGRFRYYRLIPEGIAELRASLEVFWSAELDELAAARAPREEEVSMPVEKSVVVPLGADETFALITDPERLRRWQAVTARIDLRAGGDYRWTIVPGHTAGGRVVEVDPGRRLVLSWGWEEGDDLAPGLSQVTITLEPTVGGTLVRLVHEGLPDDRAAGHGEGWEHYLGRLALAAMSGDAGPDEWAASPDPMDRLTAAEASLAACQLVLRAVTDSDATSPTPCSAFTVDELINHLLDSLSQLGSMAGATVLIPTGGSRESRVATAAQQVLEAWRRRGLEGVVPTRGGEMPAALAANILSIETLVHGWDLAVATAQELHASTTLGEYVLGLARELITPEMRDGELFTAEHPVAPEAGVLERLAALTGRNP